MTDDPTRFNSDPRLRPPGTRNRGKPARPRPAGYLQTRRRQPNTQLPLRFTQDRRKLLQDRYELGALLGWGGMASVYAGIDRRMDRPVAIKVFHREVAASAFINDIIRGNRAAAGLSHPYLASVFDVDIADESPYVIMELLAGPSLASLITDPDPRRPREPLPWSRIVGIAVQICSALIHLQQHNLQHGDLKPSNVVLTCRRSLKLIDLDLCALGTHDPSIRRVGTFPWMSPEQVLHGIRDSVSEIFTVGVLLYQLTTGELPFRGTSDEILHNLAHHEFTPPHALAPSMPPQVEQVILTALEKRHRRFACLPELIHALEASLTNPAVAAWERRGDDRPRSGRPTMSPVLTLTHLSNTALGQGHTRRPALAHLRWLLGSLFDRDEFHRFLRLEFAGNHLLDQLGADNSTDRFFLAAIEALARRGLIDAVFFRRLGEQRPLRWNEIRWLAERLNVGDPLPVDSPPDDDET